MRAERVARQGAGEWRATILRFLVLL